MRTLAVATAAAVVATFGVAAIAGPAAAAPVATSDTGLWIVRLAEPSLAAHQAPSGTVDVSTSAARAYIDRLAERQAAVADLISNRLERPVEVKRSYRNVLNAIVIEAEAAEAAGLAAVPGVVAVEPDVEYELTTDTSHDLIGSAAIWGGDTGQDAATRGEGVVVGILDSGINPFHPSFAATDGEGYTHTNPYSGSLGVCAARRASRRAPALSRDVHPRVVTEVEKPRRVPIITSTRGHDHVGAALLQRRGKHHRSRHAATPTGRHQLQDRHTAELAADPPARHPQ